MGRKKSFKKPKKKIEFDEQDRVEYLTGFRKRNLERKMKAREKLNTMLKEEKKRIKQKRKEALQKALISQRQVPEIEHLLKPVTIDLPEHTVTISEIEDFNSVPVTNPLHTAQITEVFSPSKDEEVEKIQKLIKEMKSKKKVQPSKNSKVALLAKKQQKKADKLKAKKLQRELKKSSKHTKKKTLNRKK